MNRENLTKLATYLEQLPIDYKHFDMEGYYDKDHQLTHEQALDYALNNGGVDKFNCGTVACAVGHGPAAGILFKPSEITWYDKPNWDRYARNFVDDTMATDFRWLFSSEWEHVDNTHRGAAARIRYLLDGHAPQEPLDPDDYRVEEQHHFEADANKIRALYAEFLVP